MSNDVTGAHTPAETVPAHAAAEEGGHRRRTLIVLAIIGVLLLLIAAAFAWYLITRKPLTELPGLNREAMPAFSYSIYGVDQPMGVAVSEDGERIYVTEIGGKRQVLEFDHQGTLLNTFSAPKNVKAGTSVPLYVAINPTTQEVYVTDRGTRSLYVYTQDGTYKRTIKPTGVKGTFVPLGLAFAPDGTLYVSEVGAKPHRILVINQNDAVVSEITSETIPLAFPNCMAIDGDGNLFVTDSNNGRLLAFDRNGRQLAAVDRGIGDGDLGLPRGLSVDGDGRVVVIDTTNQRMSAYRLVDTDDGPSLAFVGVAGDEGIADGQFNYPNGAATDSRSNVYITDRENGRVQVWSW